jgi:predicted glycosyltransferase
MAISHSSFYSPFVAKLLRAPCIYLNDNEHAAGNRISFIFADRILVPEFLDSRKIQRQWGRLHKVIKYPGIKEGIYLWKYNQKNTEFIHKDRSQEKKQIYIRPEPLTAQYYKGQQNFMDDLLVGLAPHVSVVMLPRTADQKTYYRQEQFKHVHIPKQSIELKDLIKTCDLFIGAGGTMTREAAVMGIPTISIYQDELLDVDQYLINNDCMVHYIKFTADLVLNFLAQSERKAPNKILMQKGERAYQVIKKLVLSRANSSFNDPAQTVFRSTI